MEVEVLATVLGAALAALVAACGAGFRWLRSDFRDLRSHADTRFQERTEATNTQFAEINGRLDRLEAKFDDLIMALARAGSLIAQQPAAFQAPSLAPESGTAEQPSDPAPKPTDAPAGGFPPSEALYEIAGPPRAPPTTSGQPSADRPLRPPPANPLGPTAAPA